MNADDIKSIFDGLDEPTKDFAVRPLKEDIGRIIVDINRYLIDNGLTTSALCPPPALILNAFRACGGVDQVRVVIIGQDPFIKRGEAHGLSFSVPRDISVPPSLKNIYKALHRSGLIPYIPSHGDLTLWAQQGVLLLNCALTTVVGRSNAHAHIWQQYTDKLIMGLSHRAERMIFILLGGFAQKKASLIDSARHSVLTWGHPSPLNAANHDEASPSHFIHCSVFTETNKILEAHGSRPIDWSVDPQEYLEGSTRPDTQRPTGPALSRLLEDYAGPVVDGKLVVQWPAPVRHADTPSSPTLYIFTDGAASANGKAQCRSAWGVYITNKCYSVALAGPVEGPHSNNRGELMAIYHALKYMDDDRWTSSGQPAPTDVTLVTDSKYSIDCLEDWLVRWLQDQAALAQKKNLDILVPSLRLLTRLRLRTPVHLKHVRGHQTEPTNRNDDAWHYWNGNNRADGLCTSYLKQ